MKSNLFKLNLSDVGKGLLVAVLASVFTWLASALNAPGFSWATIDWNTLIQVAMASGIGYIAKNFVTTEDGKILGIGK